MLRLRWLALGFLAAAVVVAPAAPSSARSANGPPTQHFHSEPGLHPPAVSVTSDADTSSGDIFLTPRPSAPSTQGYGLMILNPEGHLVWYHPVTPEVPSNLEVQSYRGQPALTWSQGRPEGAVEDVIANRFYQTVAVVRAGNGYTTDPHDFVITPQGTAWLLGWRDVTADLAQEGGPSTGTVIDDVIQEVDIATGEVKWQWDAYQNIPLTAGYTKPSHGVYDAYHLNSLQVLPGGNLLVSSRSTWSVYEISISTGQILWTLGARTASSRQDRALSSSGSTRLTWPATR
jgi:hypothetical protein